jgi:hypothetical protein
MSDMFSHLNDIMNLDTEIDEQKLLFVAEKRLDNVDRIIATNFKARCFLSAIKSPLRFIFVIYL